MIIDCDRIRKKLTTSIFGNEIICLNVTDSTNAHILELARKGAPEGLIVVADFQTAGRGRRERRWFSPPAKNLLFSLLFKPQARIEEVQKITLAAAGVVADGIESFLKSMEITLPAITVKWPNDLLANGRKLCGILSESILHDKEITSLAIGCGLNVNMVASELPEEIREEAVSLKDLTGKDLIREEILAHILNQFEQAYEKWERSNYAHVVEEWKKRCKHIGQALTIVTPDKKFTAIFEDVSEKGYLVYRREDGAVKELISGEVQWL